MVAVSGLLWAEDTLPEPSHLLKITSKCSLIHLGSLDSFDITTGGTQAAKLLYEAVDSNQPKLAEESIRIYEKITPSENFGGEYTALDWISHFIIAGKGERRRMTSDRISLDWVQYWSANGYQELKNYLKMKYHLKEWAHLKTPKSEPHFRFLEDFILFNNPWREHWEKTDKIIESLDLKPGAVVADVGSGPGYFTFKFAQLVGATGDVYAIETNPRHVEYVKGLVKKFDAKNVHWVAGTEAGFEIGKKADLAFLCSLYHNVYATTNDSEVASFLNGIRKNLKPDGSLVIVDNALVEQSELPYHGPYISKDLIIEQLWFHGFRLVKSLQFIPQRYILIFKPMPVPPTLSATSSNPLEVPVNSGRALVHASRNATSPGFTFPGRKAARVFLQALNEKTPDAFRAAIAAYDSIIPKERFGDEYTAFRWLCEYNLATPETKTAMLSEWQIHDYFDLVTAGNYDNLKLYLRTKYFLDRVLDDEDATRTGKKKESGNLDELDVPEKEQMTQNQANMFGEFIAFSNPAREQWEKTSKVLDYLKIKQGDRIADLGSGPGYYTFKFSKLVGDTGTVFAVDTEQEQLDKVLASAKKHEVRNIRPVLARDNDSKLPENSVDLVYICSMYHAAYFISMEYVRDGFINGIKKALAKNGRLVISDNMILGDDQNRYYGPSISPELLIAQLKHYGFHLVDRTQFIPQRYVLVFERDN